jgi:hypothetical protein
MALLSVQQLVLPTLVLPSFGAAALTDTVRPDDDRVFLWYKNTNGATRDVNISTPSKFDLFGETFPDVGPFTLAITTGEALIPIPDVLADPATGLVTVTVSAIAGVTVAAVRR